MKYFRLDSNFIFRIVGEEGDGSWLYEMQSDDGSWYYQEGFVMPRGHLRYYQELTKAEIIKEVLKNGN